MRVHARCTNVGGSASPPAQKCCAPSRNDAHYFFGSRTWGEIMRGDRMTMHGGLAQCWTRCIAAVSKSCRIGRVTWWPRAVGSKKGASCFPFSRRAAQGGQSRSCRGRDAPGPQVPRTLVTKVALQRVYCSGPNLPKQPPLQIYGD